MTINEKIKRLLNNEYARTEWIKSNLEKIPHKQKILDAGCGSQKYKRYCNHLDYYAQDFGKFVLDENESYTAIRKPYHYGKLDYVGDIWEISEKDSFFEAILCTEVLEHIPYPNETIKEFARLLKPGGTLLLTVPSNSLRHMDPYYYYSGFSDRYLQKILTENFFTSIAISASGSYHGWLMVEDARCMRNEGFKALLTLWPAFLYHYLKQKRPTRKDVNTLCFGYHVKAVRQEGR
jgi:SAM-dependent methyltransferase